MKYFDPHIHMTSRTTDDYQAMADAGIAAMRACVDAHAALAAPLGLPSPNDARSAEVVPLVLGWQSHGDMGHLKLEKKT